MRCSFLSAALAAVAIPASARTTAKTNTKHNNRRTNEAPTSTGPHERESLLSERENLRHAGHDLDRARSEIDFFAGLALDGLDRVHADVELDALRDQAIDLGAMRIARAHEIDAGAEGDDLDGDAIGSVIFQQIIGDAENERLLLRIVVGELER